MTPQLPDVVRRFIQAEIDSVEEVSILQILAEDPAQTQSLADLVKVLRSTESSIRLRVQRLQSAGLLSRAPEDNTRYSLQGLAPERLTLIQQLLDEYRYRPNKVIETIYSRRDDRLRSLADAFHLGRKEDQ